MASRYFRPVANRRLRRSRVSSSSFFTKSATVWVRRLSSARLSLTRTSMPLLTIVPDLSEKHIDFLDDRHSARHVVRQNFQVIPLELLAFDIAPIRFGLLPFQGKLLNRLSQVRSAYSNAHSLRSQLPARSAEQSL